MDPATTADPTAPPPVPPKPSRSSFSCERHPAEQFTGFCTACLCERLTTLEGTSNGNTPSSSRRPSSVTAAVKNMFSGAVGKPPKAFKQHASSSPRLRRIKSFSASKNEALGVVSFEPQRKSCDVRARSTLSSLFTLEKEDRNCDGFVCSNGVKVESFAPGESVFEEIEVDEEFKDAEGMDSTNCFAGNNVNDDDNDDEIRPVQDYYIEALRNNANCDEAVEDIVLNVTDLKPMKDHIDFDASEKKSSVGGFWAAASVFSKKWHKWRQKQKIKRQSNGLKLTKLPMRKPTISRHCRETQSEVADYGFARRSCDTDPRFSLDTGRISFDDPRYSFDKPRASWDGHLIAAKSFPRMAPMVSLAENVPTAHVPHSDTQIPVEELTRNCPNEEDLVPGGSVQTRDYYLHSSSRRRKSLDRSSSIRKMTAEIDESSNSIRVSPNKIDSLHGGERDTEDHMNSNDRSEAIELSNGLKDIGNREKKEQSKKVKSWSLRIWGFISKLNNSIGREIEDGYEDERYSKVDGVRRSFSESWQDFRNEGNNTYTNNTFDTRSSFRSNSSASWRRNNGSFGGTMRSSVLEMNAKNSRSIRYSSPNRPDHDGLLRLYLTPMRSGRRGGIGRFGPNNSHSIARSALRLY